MKDLATKASEAVHYAMKPEPIKSGGQVVPMPMAAPGFMGESYFMESLLSREAASCSRPVS
jgi:hypothetical protein